MLRHNPLNVPGVDRLRSFRVLECDVAACTRSDHDSHNVRDVTFCRRGRRGRRDRSRNSFGTSMSETSASKMLARVVGSKLVARRAYSSRVDRLRVLGRWELWLAGLRRSIVGPRRNAASAGRQFEKCAAGAPIRGGADSPPPRGSPIGPTDWAPALGLPKPERPSSGHRRRCIFPRVRPRRRGPTCFGAMGPAN